MTAKFSRLLIERIYRYLLDENLVSSGDTILDPFGGVGLGAADALANNLSYIGVELERRFVDMGGQGCDCTGISKADWVRFYGRWDRANYKNGRYWCPQCLAETRQIKPAVTKSSQLSFLDSPDSLSAAYVQNSGKIPYTEPHRYEGNLSLFIRHAKGNATAVLLQGDSRRLIEVLRQGGIEAVVSSPPYANGEKGHPSLGSVNKDNWGAEGTDIAKRRGGNGRYGDTESQLANLPTGDLKAVVTSSPFAGNSGGRGEASRNGIDAALFDRHQGGMVRGLGETGGNLGAMQPKQSDLKAIVTSSPFVDSVGSDDPDKRGGLYRVPKRRNDTNLTGTYGDSDGQLGAMKAGEIEAVVSSPPYADAIVKTGKVNPESWSDGRVRNVGVSQKESVGYGDSAGQIGATSGDTFWSAARLILEQCYMLLPDGGAAVFVCKDFVKDWQRVPFSAQWAELCQAIGFVPYAHFRAWQVKPGPVQKALVGDDKDYTKEYKSFFRRDREKKGSPRIDWEDVLIFRKEPPHA